MSQEDALKRILEWKSKETDINIEIIKKDIEKLHKNQRVESIFLRIIGCFIFILFGFTLNDSIFFNKDEINLEKIYNHISTIKNTEYLKEKENYKSSVELIIPSKFSKKEDYKTNIEEGDELFNSTEKKSHIVNALNLEERPLEKGDFFLPSPAAPRHLIAEVIRSSNIDLDSRSEKTKKENNENFINNPPQNNFTNKPLSDKQLLDYDDDIIDPNDELLYLQQ